MKIAPGRLINTDGCPAREFTARQPVLNQRRVNHGTTHILEDTRNHAFVFLAPAKCGGSAAHIDESR
jgi:hypothetical protein